jgi:hypothetical protein
MAFDPASLIVPGVNIIGSLLGSLFGGGAGGSTTAKTPPERPKPEFQPMQRQPMASRQPVNFDPGATGGGIDPNDTRLQAIQSLRGKLGL